MHARKSHTNHPEDRRTWVALVPIVLAAAVVALTLVGVTDQRAVRMEPVKQASASLSQLLPQGWAFFTKPPQTPRYRLYTVEQGELVDEISKFSVDHTSLYGWNRSYRNVAAERELVERVLADVELNECSDGDIVTCFSDLDTDSPQYSAETFTKTPRLCGAFYVSVAEPVPWAWRDLVDEQVRVTGVTTLEVSC